MGVILDTHAFAWAVTEPHRLGGAALALLERRDVEVYVSSASAWEMATKVRLGRWPDAVAVSSRFASAIEEMAAQPLPVTVDDALLAGRMAWEHRDPFDRMLAAQAIRRSLTLLSRDEAFGDLAGLSLDW